VRIHKLTVLIAVLLFIFAIALAACDDKGQPCPHKNAVKVTNGSHLRCKYDPTTGGNTWQ
jgi:hypothetical protein